MYIFSYFPFGFDGRILDLIVSVLEHCLSFYFEQLPVYKVKSFFLTLSNYQQSGSRATLTLY